VVNLILHTFACIGLCFILKYGFILSFFRDKLVKYKYFKELFSCSLCIGFWSGLFIGIVGPYNPFIFAVYGAAICWYADHMLTFIAKIGK
jgi:hypothetical protein